MKTVDIFYKTYRKDLRLLKYSLLSVSMFVKNYRNIILLIPENERHYFEGLEPPERTIIHYVKEYGNGYLFQQVCKIRAHNYSDADFIMYSDSDCIFDHDINVNDFIFNDKPEILFTDYSKVGEAICWQKPTEDFIKEPVQFEYMRRNCMVYHRTTLENIDKYEPNLEYNIMNSDRFSEYNAMGAYARKYEQHKYVFTNTDSLGIDPMAQNVRPIAVQLWSWADKNDNSSFHKKEYKKILETINRVFGLQIIEI